MKGTKTQFATFLLSMACLLSAAHGQLTPSQDAYTNTASPSGNFGAKTLLDVESSSQTTYIQFDLTAIPSGFTGSNIAKATLKLYVNTVIKSGSFNVNFVNGTWAEATITANLAPALGTTILPSVPLTTANKGDYLLVDITPALQAWLNQTQANDGIALVGNSPLNATFDSKESTTTSHPPELDIVFAGGGSGGITGINTASGSGLIGGGTSGTLNLSLTNACAANQVLQWNGTAWICASTGTGTITGVTAGTDLTGGGSSGNVTLNLDTNRIPQLAVANTFAANQTINANLTATGTVTASALAAVSATFSDQVAVNSADLAGVYSTGSFLYGIVGHATAIQGGIGVEGLSDSTDLFSSGVEGIGVTGVYGEAIGYSSLGRSVANASGVWGDSGIKSAWGVLGTADNGGGGVFENNSSGYYALFGANYNSTGFPLGAFNYANNTYCYVDAGGSLNCTGAKHAVVPIDGGQRRVALSAIESPKNWFEDTGSSHLLNGSAVVMLEPDFLQTVNTNLEYHVFLTANGDSNGLYIANKTATSFEVREQGGGTSSIAFDYRLMALRKNYESIRFEDHSNDPDPRKMLMQKRRDGNQPGPQMAREKSMKRQPRRIPIASQ